MNITILPSINPPDYAAYVQAAVEEGVTIFETAGSSREHYVALSFKRVLTNGNYSGQAGILFERKQLYRYPQVYHYSTRNSASSSIFVSSEASP